MANTTYTRSRLRSASYALAAGMVLSPLMILVPVIDTGGLSAVDTSVLSVLPGVLAQALAYYLPAAVGLGFGLSRLMDRNALFRLRLVWAAAGLLFTTAMVWLVRTAFSIPPFDETMIQVVAVGCGLAGRWGYRDVWQKSA